MTDRGTDQGKNAPDQAELQAYVDGQLNLSDRAGVEAWLARHPEAAAAVMADLQLMSRLRASLGHAPDGASPQVAAAAGRLDRARRRDHLWRQAARFLPGPALAAVLAVLAFGIGPVSVRSLTAASLPPGFVQSALSAHDTMQLRAGMRSQPETPDLDAEEIRAATGILLPAFPPDWRLRDVQIFPSAEGPGVELLFDLPNGGAMTLFSLRPGDFALTAPATRSRGPGSLAWVRMGETAHVLVSDLHSEAALAALAATLFEPIL